MDMTAGAGTAYGQAWRNTACAPATTCAPLPHCCGHHHGCCYHPVVVKAICTCPPVWGGLCPPPWCPVHGRAQMLTVRC